MKYTHVLFDLDGTITNSAPGITRCFNEALAHVGLPQEDPASLEKVIIGPPILDGFAAYHVDSEKLPLAVGYFRQEYRSRGWMENAPYPEVRPMLDALRKAGVHIFIATSKAADSALRILRHFDLDHYFEYIAGADLSRNKGTKDEVLDDAFAHMTGVDPAKIVMVGDRKYDLTGAKNHGIDGIGVLYGFGAEEELSSLPHVFLAKTPLCVSNFILNP